MANLVVSLLHSGVCVTSRSPKLWEQIYCRRDFAEGRASVLWKDVYLLCIGCYSFFRMMWEWRGPLSLCVFCSSCRFTLTCTCNVVVVASSRCLLLHWATSQLPAAITAWGACHSGGNNLSKSMDCFLKRQSDFKQRAVWSSLSRLQWEVWIQGQTFYNLLSPRALQFERGGKIGGDRNLARVQTEDKSIWDWPFVIFTNLSQILVQLSTYVTRVKLLCGSNYYYYFCKKSRLHILYLVRLHVWGALQRSYRFILIQRFTFEVRKCLSERCVQVKLMHADAAPASVSCWSLLRSRRSSCKRPPAVYPSFIDSSPSCSEVNQINLLFSNTAWKDTSQFPAFPARAQGCNITLRSIYNICVGVTRSRLCGEQAEEHLVSRISWLS